MSVHIVIRETLVGARKNMKLEIEIERHAALYNKREDGHGTWHPHFPIA
jgi:hypothetical protein